MREHKARKVTNAVAAWFRIESIARRCAKVTTLRSSDVARRRTNREMTAELHSKVRWRTVGVIVAGDLLCTKFQKRELIRCDAACAACGPRWIDASGNTQRAARGIDGLRLL